MNKSIYYHYGRLVGLIEAKCRREGWKLSPSSIDRLYIQPAWEWPKYVIDLRSSAWTNIRLEDILNEVDGTGWPDRMTLDQQADAQLGAAHEKLAIERGWIFWDARRRSGLSQEDFAQKIGASRESVRDWETHRADCPGPVIKLIQALWPSP